MVRVKKPTKAKSEKDAAFGLSLLGGMRAGTGTSSSGAEELLLLQSPPSSSLSCCSRRPPSPVSASIPKTSSIDGNNSVGSSSGAMSITSDNNTKHVVLNNNEHTTSSSATTAGCSCTTPTMRPLKKRHIEAAAVMPACALPSSLLLSRNITHSTRGTEATTRNNDVAIMARKSNADAGAADMKNTHHNHHHEITLPAHLHVLNVSNSTSSTAAAHVLVQHHNHSLEVGEDAVVAPQAQAQVQSASFQRHYPPQAQAQHRFISNPASANIGNVDLLRVHVQNMPPAFSVEGSTIRHRQLLLEQEEVHRRQLLLDQQRHHRDLLALQRYHGASSALDAAHSNSILLHTSTHPQHHNLNVKRPAMALAYHHHQHPLTTASASTGATTTVVNNDLPGSVNINNALHQFVHRATQPASHSLILQQADATTATAAALHPNHQLSLDYKIAAAQERLVLQAAQMNQGNVVRAVNNGNASSGNDVHHEYATR